MSHLNEHERVHTGLTPFKCKFCSYSSGIKGNLVRHERKHEKEEALL